MASSTCTRKLPVASPSVSTRRLGSVLGDGDKRNDIIWAGKRDVPAERNVIFFAGDVQDYLERMLGHRDNYKYASWDLETMARLMVERFPRSHAWVVKASVMTSGTLNAFVNFYKWNDKTGGPAHSSGQNSWRHLVCLLANSVETMNSASVNDASLHVGVGCQRFSTELPLTLVGFSKGCTVLNQLVYDFLECYSEIGKKKCPRKIDTMYWLDGGHNGGSDTWVTDDPVLVNFHDLGRDISLYAHVTPKQINDPTRPWIGGEYKEFVAKLGDLGAKITAKEHFEDEPPSLERHFQVLLVF